MRASKLNRYAKMKFSYIILLSVFLMSQSSIAENIGPAKIRDCGKEVRFNSGELFPLVAGFNGHPEFCKDCNITYTFDTPAENGPPIVTQVTSSGLTPELEDSYVKWFEAEWIFLHCLDGQEKKGFTNEVITLPWSP